MNIDKGLKNLMKLRLILLRIRSKYLRDKRDKEKNSYKLEDINKIE
jgi:hypothetical protein